MTSSQIQVLQRNNCSHSKLPLLLAFVVASATTSAHALYEGRSKMATRLAGPQDDQLLLGTSARGEDSVDQMLENFDFDEDSIAHALRYIWGKAQWPLPGQASIPPREVAAAPSTFQSLLSVIPLALFCMMLGSAIFLTRQPKPVAGWNSKVQQDVAPVAPTTWWRNSFTVHLHALSAAIIWRHLHHQAVVHHAMRCAVPAALLCVIHRFHNWIINQLSHEQFSSALRQLGPGIPHPTEIADAIVEYVFTVSLLYVTISAMSVFVYHVSAESESGLRKLLHVSGLSRMAYLVATLLLDGVGHAMMGLCVMMAIAGIFLQVRMAVWTSPGVLMLVVMGLVIVTNSLAMFFPFFFRNARTCNFIVSLLSAFLFITVPFTPFGSVAPQAVRGLLLPIIPGYRALFELVAACGKGRCLQLVDVFDAWHRRDWVPMWGILVSSPKGIETQLTPVGALLSFSHLMVFQFLIACGLLIMLDSWRYPTLHATGAQSEKDKKEEDRCTDGEPGAEGLVNSSCSGSGALSSKGVVLEVKGLEHRYGLLQKLPMMSQTVLSGVSFTLAPGSILGLLGPNGAGKTTTIRCITGEEQPCKGTVAIHGKGNGAVIGLCPQDTIVNSELTVRENMLFFAFLRGKNDSNEASRLVEHFLFAARLKEKEHSFTNTLSGGMLRRLGVCCAMIGTPHVAILDEPTTGLDPVSRRSIWKTINDVRHAGSCCLMTTHMLEEAEALCSYVVILRKGTIAAEGSAQQLKEEWGTGYMLNIDSNAGEEALALNFVASLLYADNRKPIKVSPQGQMTFKLLVEEEALGHLIIAISKGKESNGIKRWGISQASLEDAYVRIIQGSPEESSFGGGEGQEAREARENREGGEGEAEAAVGQDQENVSADSAQAATGV